jgi:hypothetical protein
MHGNMNVKFINVRCLSLLQSFSSNSFRAEKWVYTARHTGNGHRNPCSSSHNVSISVTFNQTWIVSESTICHKSASQVFKRKQ